MLIKTKIGILLLALVTTTFGYGQDVKVFQTDSLIKDLNNDSKAGPGDSIRYKVTISVSGDSAKMVSLDTINPDSNLVVDPGSIHISPLARKDSFKCLGNVGLEVPIAGLLGNDKDLDGGTLMIDSAGGLITNTPTMVNFTTSRGGTANVKMDGSFTYSPPPGYIGKDTFRYELSDGDPVTPNKDALVCINITDVIIFVNNANPSPGNGGKGFGTLDDPYVNFSLINGINGIGDEDSSGATIFLYAGNSPTATMEYEGIDLEDDQKFIGEGALESIQSITGLSLPVHSLLLPSTGGIRPVIKDLHVSQDEEGIELANNNDIRGLIVRNGGARGIHGQNVGGNTFIKNVRLENNALEEIFLINQSGSFMFQDDTIICSVDDGIFISQGSADIDFINTKQIHSDQIGVRISGSSADVSFSGGSSIQQTGGTGINIASSSGTYEFDSLTVVGGLTGVNMTNSGSATLTIGYANIQTTGGTGINASGGGTINITNGTSVLTASGGKALDLDGNSLGVTLANITSTNSPTSGIELDNISGSLTINGGSIVGASGTAYDVGGAGNSSGGNATVVYTGSITNTAGRAVLIQELGGGSHTLSGNITHNASAEGIQVSEINNGGSATVTFGGTTKTINSGSSHAVDLNSNTNGTINFTNGGLVVDATSGIGFNASGGGTVNVTGSGNTIGSSNPLSAGAINISDVTIGGNGVTFQMVNVNGNGTSTTPAIVLDDTGMGSFSITGTGTTDGSGGTIRAIQEDAIRLFNTDGLVSISNLDIYDVGNTAVDAPGHHVFDGQQVDGGLTLVNMTIERCTDSAIHGEAPGGGSTTWNGLTFTDCKLAFSNRFNVAGVADGGSTDEAMITIEGISGIVSILRNDFDDGPGFINLFTANSGTVDITIQSNTFDDGRKDLSGMASVGSSGVRVNTTGTIDADIRIGDPLEANNTLGNTFTDAGSDAAIFISGFSASDNADVDLVISRNTSTVMDHTSPPGLCNPANGIANCAFDFPNGGIGVESRGSGTFEAIVSHNTLIETQNSGGLSTGSLRIDVSGDDTEVIVRNNTLTKSWDGPLFIRADDADGNGAEGFLEVRDNVYNSGMIGVPGSGDDLDVFGFANSPAPFLPNRYQVRNGATLDLTINNDDMVSHDTGSNPQFDSHDFRINGDAVGGTSSILNLLIQNSEGPEDFNLRNDDSGVDATDSELNLSRGLSPDPAATDITPLQAESIFDDNINTTGGGASHVNVPFSGVNIVTTTPTLPVVTAPLKAAIISNSEKRISVLKESEVTSILGLAKEIWKLSEISMIDIARLDLAVVNISQLHSSELANSFLKNIQIDQDAAGHGWFIDPTPSKNEEFELLEDGSYKAIEGSEADSKIDLLTVLLHEIGHLIGKEHSDSNLLMQENLEPGIRKLPLSRMK